MSDRIADMFDMDHLETIPPDVREPDVSVLEDERLDETTDDRLSRLALEDFEVARGSILDILKDSEEVMKLAKTVAISSQNSKDMATYIGSAKAHIDNWKTLTGLHKDAQVHNPVAEGIQQAETINTTTTNIIFTGDTADFAAKLREMGITKGARKLEGPKED